MKSRFPLIIALVMLLTALMTSTVLAGEITGNGQLKEVKGHSECAYSGQEDLQWYTTDDDITPVATFVRGVPGHSQSWGQAKPMWAFLISIGLHPGIACNPTKSGGGD
jgi:hypothetical protein